jgi:phosphoribosyl-AMP cyclohydrolase
MDLDAPGEDRAAAGESSSPFGAGPWRPDGRGLVAAVVQERGSGRVLMLAWMDAEAVRRTLATGRATYWSRSRGEYWVKGETSGHAQHVHRIQVDCDGDALLLEVDQVGAACHTGLRSCFDTVEVIVESGREANAPTASKPTPQADRRGL